MTKKILFTICTMSLLTFTGCNMLPIAPKDDYESEVMLLEYYQTEYASLLEANEEFDQQVADLNDQIATLEAEQALLKDDLEEALAGSSSSQSDSQQEVIVDITDRVALKMNIPASFVDNGKGGYRSSAVNDNSNILINVRTGRSAELMMTQDELEENLLNAFKQQNLNVDSFEIVRFEKRTISGYDMLITEYQYKIGTIEIQQIQLIMDADESCCSIVFTTGPEYGWYEEFCESVEKIQIGVAQ